MPVDSFVVDCSVAVAWCFHDKKNAYADAIAARFPQVSMHVPALWHLEIANVLLVGERRGRSTQTDTQSWLGFLATLPLSVDGQTITRAWSDTLPLARIQSLSVYDASYLELAIRLGLPLASLDNELKAAAKVVGVPHYKP